MLIDGNTGSHPMDIKKGGSRPSTVGSEEYFTDAVRRYLETLSTEDVPITYGQLARALRMFAPGSIRKVTGALEATMREDAATGRPFIAALVVSRGSLSQPGKGFFDLARLLGRGPDPGQSDADYYRQEIELLTEH